MSGSLAIAAGAAFLLAMGGVLWLAAGDAVFAALTEAGAYWCL
ncbi:hypothetical protein [Acuticoccus sp.]